MTADAVVDAPYMGFVDVPDPAEELIRLWADVDALVSLPVAATAVGEKALAAAQLIARVRHAADALLAPYAARLEELSGPELNERFARYKGFPNAAELLSATTGLSRSEAAKLIGLGRAVDRHVTVESAPEVIAPVAEPMEELLLGEEAAPERVAAPAPAPSPTPRRVLSPLAAAIRAGLGTEKANLIQRTLDDMTARRDEAEAFLAERAGKLTIVQLRRLCFETFAEFDPQGYADREERQQRDRFVTFRTELDGMVSFFGKLPPIAAAPLKAWLEAETDAEVFGQRELPRDQQRTLGQIMADSFVDMARHVAGCTKATSRPKTTMVIRASRESLATGTGHATADGIEAPIPIATALLAAVDLEFAALLTDDEGQPLKFGRTRRSASRAQRLVAMERDKGCAQCHRAISRCNAHHIIEWDYGGPTDQDNLVMLCIGCHHRLHENGWGISVENYQVWFIPPATVDPQRRRQPGSSVRL
ncbi:DUF222 domain-containing protein [Demequina sp.]|uniref:HNH endonuclease n=1 Tax=Demequina sp. TaxID=2050685 RepID=UPI003D0D9037